MNEPYSCMFFPGILRENSRNFISRNQVVAIIIENHLSQRLFSDTKQLVLLVVASVESSVKVRQHVGVNCNSQNKQKPRERNLGCSLSCLSAEQSLVIAKQFEGLSKQSKSFEGLAGIAA